MNIQIYLNNFKHKEFKTYGENQISRDKLREIRREILRKYQGFAREFLSEEDTPITVRECNEYFLAKGGIIAVNRNEICFMHPSEEGLAEILRESGL
jgi:hypothetical protein